ncbi:hypothetical protein ACFLWT_01525 [Chloroflexota bacterium]
MAIKTGILNNQFPEKFSNLLEKSGVSCYQISNFTGIDPAYLSRLRNSSKHNPSPEVIVKIGLALVRHGKGINLYHIEQLLNSAGYTLKIKY